MNLNGRNMNLNVNLKSREQLKQKAEKFITLPQSTYKTILNKKTQIFKKEIMSKT